MLQLRPNSGLGVGMTLDGCASATPFTGDVLEAAAGEWASGE